MDRQQSHLHTEGVIRALRIASASLFFLLNCGCTPRAERAERDLERRVAATLTAHALNPTQAPPTQPQPSPSPAPSEPPPTSTPQPPTPPPPSATPAEGNVPGVISGTLSYPSESIPRMAVVFFNLEDGSWWWIGTAPGQANYRMTVPVGRYHVVAYAQGGLAGGYTAAVPCGLSVGCTDHALLPVVVGSNGRVRDIHVGDWYAPDGSFLPKPSAIEYP